MNVELLNNPAWYALTSHHSHFALGQGLARHYPRAVAPYSAIRELSKAALSDLAIDLPLGDVRMFRPQRDEPPVGWHTISAHPIMQMLMSVENLPPRLAGESTVSELGPSDTDDILALVEIARPGPFSRQTPMMGRYVGVRDTITNRLIAMGGERFHLDGYVELSAIAVHPEARGRGLGAAVTASLARAAHDRGEVPFLHVYASNSARPLYNQLGFEVRNELWVLLWRPGN